MVDYSTPFYYQKKSHIGVLQPPANASIGGVWANTFSLSATKAISLISFPRPT